VLELMHFADEIVDMKTLDLPAQETPHANEMKVARMLIDTMTEAFDAGQFRDTYREEILAMIEVRAAGKEMPEPAAAAPKTSNVVNLMDVLQRSLEESKKSRGAAKPSASAEKKAAEAKTKKTTRRKTSAA
jgi:DNA end-binding protein Ku